MSGSNALEEYYLEVKEYVLGSFVMILNTVQSLLDMNPSFDGDNVPTLEELIIGVDGEFSDCEDHVIFAGSDGFFKSGHGFWDAFYALQEVMQDRLTSVEFYGAVSTYTWNVLKIVSMPVETEYDVIEPSKTGNRQAYEMLEMYMSNVATKHEAFTASKMFVVASDISEARLIAFEMIRSLPVTPFHKLYECSLTCELSRNEKSVVAHEWNGSVLLYHLAQLVMRSDADITTIRVPLFVVHDNATCTEIGSCFPVQTLPAPVIVVEPIGLPLIPVNTFKKWTAYCRHCNERHVLDFSVLEDPKLYKQYLMCSCGKQHSEVEFCKIHQKWFFKSQNQKYRKCPKC